MSAAVQTKSKYHILFKETIKKDTTITVDGMDFDITVERSRFKLYIGSVADKEIDINAIIEELSQATKNDEIEIHISSAGGLVHMGKILINTIISKFKGRITTYIDSQAHSMAGIIFLIGDKRIIYENSSWHGHDYRGGVVGTGGNMETTIKHYNKHLRKFIKKYLRGDIKYLSKDEWKLLKNGKEIYLDARKLCKRGMATHIVVDDKEIAVKQYLKRSK